jgi:hypothetical protein
MSRSCTSSPQSASMACTGTALALKTQRTHLKTERAHSYLQYNNMVILKSLNILTESSRSYRPIRVCGLSHTHTHTHTLDSHKPCPLIQVQTAFL